MKTAAALVLLLTLTFAAIASAELNGSLYAVAGANPPIAFMFSVSDQTFVTAILTFGAGGNGRFFLATGTTDGVTGSGFILSPQNFGLPVVPNSSFQFELTGDGSTGTFATVGLAAFLSETSGTIVRVVP